MNRDTAIARQQAHEAELRRLGVQHLYLFGSTARGEAREDSDVDLFFDYEKGTLSLFDVMGVQERASDILGRHADVMTRDSLHKVLKERIDNGAPQEALKIYLFMADGDPSLDGGYLGARIGECYERMGDLHAAKFWYGRAVEENPGIDHYVDLRKRLEHHNIYELVPRSSFVVPRPVTPPGRPKRVF